MNSAGAVSPEELPAAENSKLCQNKTLSSARVFDGVSGFQGEESTEEDEPAGCLSKKRPELESGGSLLRKENAPAQMALFVKQFLTSKNIIAELWFQQDGATCHTARATIDLLKDTFGDRLISRFGPVNWPPCSCDLTPLDYFLWGYVKSLVFPDKPQTLDHLEDNIRRVIADIRP
ncbi:uncharacterized protein TNCV_4412271 [Trichonephila clavipes]|nr:uncharacterized protein TNCV_4412271 [Trichonephila clavipes]